MNTNDSPSDDELRKRRRVIYGFLTGTIVFALISLWVLLDFIGGAYGVSQGLITQIFLMAVGAVLLGASFITFVSRRLFKEK